MKRRLGIVTGPTWPEKVFFRVSHPIIPTVLFLSGAAFLAWVAQSSRAFPWHIFLAAYLAGILLWTLIEYGLHRFVFHWTSISEPWRTVTSGLHLAHHKNSDDRSLIIAPPTVAVIYSAAVFFILWSLSQSWAFSAIALAGTYSGYVFYEWVHYGAHQYQPQSALGKYLKQYHLTHHFKYPHEDFGVTSPLWDYVFRTHR